MAVAEQEHDPAALMPVYLLIALLLMCYPDIACVLIWAYLSLLIWRHF